MKAEEYMARGESVLLHTYNRTPIVFDRGEGVCLYDIEGKRYLDFAAGIAVFGLGYHNPKFDAAVKEQVDKLIHTSNLYYNVPAIEAAEKLVKATGMDRVFFTNSGTEAIEGAIKTARKYAVQKDGRTDHEIIAMNHSFHGRSMGALSVTGNPHYQQDFRPLIGGVRFAEYNDLDSVLTQVTDRTCAVILEPIQGEGGIYPADAEFLRALRKLCDERDILLIFDEIQCGMGRSGKMFACQHAGVQPDVMTVAKALGNGLPIGAFLTTEKAASLVPGDHGSTYGGNPLVCAGARAVLDIFESEDILGHVCEVGAYLWDKLELLREKYPIIKEHRGKGLIQGLEFRESPAEIARAAIKRGVILITAENNVIRFVPPLIIEKEHVDEMAEVLEESIKE
ncbi:aspartate aminotransferase family protein [Qiania dongpingensis]|uniref:Acetylornithine aminotransferase n=1 Tax=Qiania dongpingensis TaxID=2763669 RepID=A0A7G9G6H8_9FIRM|nr:aspartate aminotransferase family protein [Qiania dongpingensis]QNM06410.1 aspartate aminotransferase family protein [Qiania dongpingensis]